MKRSWVRVFKSRPLMALSLGLMALLSYQHCGRIALKTFDGMALFESTGFPLQMRPPSQYPIFRRYVVMVDMSNSMISGPCPFDADVPDSSNGYSGQYHEWDPNPTKTDPAADVNDHRGITRDCHVNPALEPPNMVRQIAPANSPYNLVFEHQTYPGSDPNRDRLAIVRKWIAELRNNLNEDSAAKTEIMIWPVSGGASQKLLISKYPLKLQFTNVMDPQIDSALSYLEGRHDQELSLAQMNVFDRWTNPINATLWPNPFTLSNTMGTTAPGEIITSIYDPINKNYKSLAYDGLLTGASFDVMLFGDGHITPITDQFNKVMNMWGGCNCQGPLCTGVCSQVWSSMKNAWGDPDASKLEAVDFRLSVLQALPQFYGGGYLDVHLLQGHPEHFQKRTSNAKSSFQSIADMSSQRNAPVKIWKFNDSNPPFTLAASRTVTTTFKMTHLFLFNPNVRLDPNGKLRVDSDGDGLFDDEESGAGTSSSNPRTNGFCLDSIGTHSVFGPKCTALKTSQGCDPSLDSDGDGINECEEMILGSDPYDFDTDGDAIPDSLEWIYGYNALRSDTEQYSNMDGVNNLIHFASQVPLNLDIKKVETSKKVVVSVDFQGPVVLTDEQLGSVSVDQYNVTLNSIPAGEILPVDPSIQGPMYISRLVDGGANASNVLIPTGHRLIKSTAKPRSNLLMGLLRSVDPADPKRVYWQIVELPFGLDRVNGQTQIDLSRFEQIRVMDRAKAAP